MSARVSSVCSFSNPDFDHSQPLSQLPQGFLGVEIVKQRTMYSSNNLKEQLVIKGVQVHLERNRYRCGLSCLRCGIQPLFCSVVQPVALHEYLQRLIVHVLKMKEGEKFDYEETRLAIQRHPGSQISEKESSSLHLCCNLSQIIHSAESKIYLTILVQVLNEDFYIWIV